MSIIKTDVGNLIIEGFDSDYVFQTIDKTHDYYEYEILNSWSKYINKSKVIFDVGANLGNHTIYWSTNLNSDIIYSFEPYLPNFERLKNNIENNNINNVKIINKGVGEKKGFASIKSFNETNYGSTALQYDENVNDDSIEIINLDSFITYSNIECVDFIKIDVEEFEVSVIKGMHRLLNKFKPDLWIEVGVNTFREIFDTLMPLGYVLVDIEGFNVLMLHESRHEKLSKIEDYKIIEKMFYYLNKTNTYYKNYTAAKIWVEQKNELINKKTNDYNNMKTNYEQLKEKYKINSDNYNKVKAWHAELKAKYDTNADNYKTLKEKYNNSLDIVKKHETEKLQFTDKLKKQEKVIEELNLKIQYQEEQISNYQDIKKLHEEEINLHKDDLLNYYLELKTEEEFIKELKSSIQKLETQNSYLKHENSEYKRKLSKITDTYIGNIGLKLYYLLKKLKMKIDKKGKW